MSVIITMVGQAALLVWIAKNTVIVMVGQWFIVMDGQGILYYGWSKNMSNIVMNGQGVLSSWMARGYLS